MYKVVRKFINGVETIVFIKKEQKNEGKHKIK